MALIEEQMGRLEKKNELGPLKTLKARIEAVTQDVRYGFLFGNRNGEDTLKSILKRLFRMPVDGKPVTVLQLAGLPSEIVNVIVSVLARLAFDLAIWSDGMVPMSLVCEEAHRYVPRDISSGFEPTKRALARIAKEGRKYGLSLGIVSQRPGDIDPTILSQCSTLFTMRLSNEQDQQIVRSALSDAAKSLIDFLPSLATRETIIFGEGVSLPSRVLLTEMPKEALPRGHAQGFTTAWSHATPNDAFLDDIIARWRTASHPEADSMPGPPADGEPTDPADELAITHPGHHRSFDRPLSGAAEGGSAVKQKEFGRNSAPVARQPLDAGEHDALSPALDRLAERLRSLQN